MAITDADLVTYIITNRLQTEDGDNLFLEKSGTLGRDNVTSARLWFMGRFISTGRRDEFDTWKALIYGLDSGDLTSIDAMETALTTAGSADPAQDIMIFDGMIRLAISKVYSANGQYGNADVIEEEAEEMIAGLLGKSAAGESTEDGGIPTAYTDNLTSDEVEDLIGAF